MYEPDVINLARNIFVQTRSPIQTYRALKKKGYVISETTLKQWRKKYQWNLYCEKYDIKLARYNEVVLEFDKEILIELLEMKKEVKEALKENGDDSQLHYSYLGYVKQIYQLRGGNGTDIDIDEIVDEVIEMFLNDPVAGKVLKNRRSHILKALKKKKR